MKIVKMVGENTKLGKAPPVLRDGVIYEAWKHDLSAWEVITDTEKKKRGLQVYLYGLEGRYKDVISKVAVEDLNVDEGVKVITEKLDKYLQKDKSQQAYDSYEKMCNFRRKGTQTVCEALLTFDGLLSDITAMKMVLPPEVMAYHCLKSMNMSENMEQLARATVSELTYDAMVTKIKSISQESSSGKSEGLCASDIKTEPDEVYYTRGNFQRGRGRGFFSRGVQ